MPTVYNISSEKKAGSKVRMSKRFSSRNSQSIHETKLKQFTDSITGYDNVVFENKFPILNAKLISLPTFCDNSYGIECHDEIERFKFLNVDTLPDLFKFAVKKYSHQPLLGTREILSCLHDNSDQKCYGSYLWSSYGDTLKMLNNLQLWLASHEFYNEKKMAIFCDANADCFIAMFATWFLNGVVIIISPSFSDETVSSILNDTKSEIILVDGKSKSRLHNMIKKIKYAKLVLCCRNCIIDPMENNTFDKMQILIKIISEYTMNEKKSIQLENIPKNEVLPDEHAIVVFSEVYNMVSKGTVLTHKNLISGIGGIKYKKDVWSGGIYMSSVPFCHIFELISVLTCTVCGGSIGFASNETMLKGSKALAHESEGDFMTLKPFNITLVSGLLEEFNEFVTSKIDKILQNNKKNTFDYSLNLYKNFTSYENLPKEYKKYFKQTLCSVLGGKIYVAYNGHVDLPKKNFDLINLCFQKIKPYLGFGFQTFEKYENSVKCLFLEKGCPPSLSTRVKFFPHKLLGIETDQIGNIYGEIGLSGNSLSFTQFWNGEIRETPYDSDNDGNKWFRTGFIGKMDTSGQVQIIDDIRCIIKHKDVMNSTYVVERTLVRAGIMEGVLVNYDPNEQVIEVNVIPSKDAFEKYLEKARSPAKDKLNETSLKKLSVIENMTNVCDDLLEKASVPLSLNIKYGFCNNLRNKPFYTTNSKYTSLSN